MTWSRRQPPSAVSPRDSRAGSACRAPSAAPGCCSPEPAVDLSQHGFGVLQFSAVHVVPLERPDECFGQAAALEVIRLRSMRVRISRARQRPQRRHEGRAFPIMAIDGESQRRRGRYRARSRARCVAREVLEGRRAWRIWRRPVGKLLPSREPSDLDPLTKDTLGPRTGAPTGTIADTIADETRLRPCLLTRLNGRSAARNGLGSPRK